MSLLELVSWKLAFWPSWDIYFKKFDNSVKKRILKKFEQMKHSQMSRGLHTSRFLVEEVGQFRIAFLLDEETRTKNIHFVGNHKQYEKWYMEQ